MACECNCQWNMTILGWHRCPITMMASQGLVLYLCIQTRIQWGHACYCACPCKGRSGPKVQQKRAGQVLIYSCLDHAVKMNLAIHQLLQPLMQTPTSHLCSVLSDARGRCIVSTQPIAVESHHLEWPINVGISAYKASFVYSPTLMARNI